MQIFGIIGWKNSGKTTLTCLLIEHLKARGLKVSSLKHTHHDVEFDQEGKDSFKHRQAGAGEVVLVSRHRWALFNEFGDDEPELTSLIDKLSPCDIVLIEGFKHHQFPKIQAYRSETAQDLLIDQVDGIVAVASDQPLDNLPVVNLDLNDISTISDFIVNYRPT
jgi:molybdopterin-guanine dinucleotide biosynthesis protein B